MYILQDLQNATSYKVKKTPYLLFLEGVSSVQHVSVCTVYVSTAPFYTVFNSLLVSQVLIVFLHCGEHLF